jgi:3-isopropylmalate/(R)-2-methylmalate dehydratase small subunit
MEPIRTLTSRTVVLDRDDVDTDQIIPARFLKVADWRFEADGSPKAGFVLNRPEAAGARVLVVGQNFGCGSSREHAPWALHDFGFRAIVAGSFADIFKNNALKNGLLPVEVPEDVRGRLVAAPGAEVTVDLSARVLRLADGSAVPFPIAPFARHCLLEGQDELQFLLGQEAAIAAHEARVRAEG